MQNKLDKLIDIGFRQIGYWSFGINTLNLHRSFKGSKKNVLYAFIVDDEPMYVGKAGDFMGVMNAYRHPGERSTRIRIKGKIIESLMANKKVEVYMFEQTEDIFYKDIKINLCHGLEEEIIKVMDLEWNIIGKSKRK
jgi:hypothetical protein